MCGIAGTTGADAERRTAAMLPLLKHRGPDDKASTPTTRQDVAIGATRLSIIDVAGGHQPIANEDGSVHCVLNGEIYNFRSLRERLDGEGAPVSEQGPTRKFSCTCTRNTAVRSYTRSMACTPSLSGIAAPRTLLLARDRFGEKPLFFHQAHGSLTFASELTALRRGTELAPDLDPGSVDLFFTLGYVPGPQTIFAGIDQLPPGTIAEWRPGRTAQTNGNTGHSRSTRRIRETAGMALSRKWSRWWGARSRAGWSPMCRSAFFSAAGLTPHLWRLMRPRSPVPT